MIYVYFSNKFAKINRITTFTTEKYNIQLIKKLIMQQLSLKPAHSNSLIYLFQSILI